MPIIIEPINDWTVAIPQTTEQEAFDKAYRGIIAQGRPSTVSDVNSSCRYQGKDGARCAVGQLIDTEADRRWLDDHFRGSGIAVPFEHNAIDTTLSFEFLQRLQRVHDDAAHRSTRRGNTRTFLDLFREGAAEFAHDRKLTIPEMPA